MPPGSRLSAVERYVELTAALARRELQVRYRQTLLGVLWAAGQPVLLVILLTVLFRGLFDVGENVPYDLYVFSGMVPWLFVANSLPAATSSLSANAGLLAKVRFPRTVLPLSCVVSLWPDLVLGWMLWFALAAWRGVPPTAASLWIIPLSLLLTLFVAGLAFLLSSSNARYRDIRYALPLLLQIWMLGSPIMYSLSSIPAPTRRLLAWNPLVPFLDAFRDALLAGRTPAALPILALITAAALAAGFAAFRQNESVLADIL